jgi:alanine-glyoxylate transaminase/serine-glyoxylate transaminase/serine-pyruvate transaminase
MSTSLLQQSALTIQEPPKLLPLAPPVRLLCGPGPGNADPRVHAAMSLPQIGHMDPAFIKLMEEVKGMLRYVWQTNNDFTIPAKALFRFLKTKL